MAIGLIGLGFGLELLGKGLGLIDQEQQAKEEEARLERNRQLAMMAAQDATRRGQVQAGAAETQGSRVMDAAAVGYGHGNIDSSVGQGAKAQAVTAGMTRLDALTIQNNAAREAWGYQQQADEYGAQAKRLRDAAPLRIAGGLLGLGGSLAGGAAQLGAFNPGSTAPATRNIAGSSLDAWAKKWGMNVGSQEFAGQVRGVDAALDWTKGY